MVWLFPRGRILVTQIQPKLSMWMIILVDHQAYEVFSSLGRHFPNTSFTCLSALCNLPTVNQQLIKHSSFLWELRDPQYHSDSSPSSKHKINDQCHYQKLKPFTTLTILFPFQNIHWAEPNLLTWLILPSATLYNKSFKPLCGHRGLCFELILLCLC